MSADTGKNSLIQLWPMTVHPFGAGKSITLNNIEEADNWLKKEESLWSNFTAAATQQSRAFRRHSEVRQKAFSSIRDLTRAMADGNVRPDLDDLSKNVVTAFRDLEQPPYLVAASVPGELIRGYNSDDLITGIAVYDFWVGNRGDISRHINAINWLELLRAVAQYRSKDVGASVAIARHRKAVTTALSKWEVEFKRLAEKADAFVSHANAETASRLSRIAAAEEGIEKLHADGKSRLEALEAERREQLNALERERSTALDELLSERRDALQQLEKTFREHLRLKAPAEYWKEKATRHRKMTQRWLVAVIILALVGIIGAAVACAYLLSWLDGLKSASVATASLVLLALPALLYATLIRMAHRSYRDEVRHADDADQRTTLVQTYLALTHEDTAGIQPGERLLALHALFRGSAQAESADDTPPVNVLEALLQGLKPKTGP